MTTSLIISVLYFGLLVIVLGWGAIIIWQRRRLPGFAGEVYDSNVEKNLLNSAIDRQAYIDSYVRTEWPRSGAFRCATALLCLLALPLLVSLFGDLLEMIWRVAGIGFGPYGLGQIAQDFLLVIIIMAIYGAVLYLVTAYYYRTAPPTLAQELKRLEGEAQ